MDKIKNYEDLLVWQKAHLLTKQIYKITRKFPKAEFFALTSQLRRAAYSVPSNIFEGFARHSRKEYLRFLFISRGSLSETDYFLRLSFELGYLSREDFDSLKKISTDTFRLLNGLITALKPSA